MRRRNPIIRWVQTAIMIAFLITLFAVCVWPTPYAYRFDRARGVRVRLNRWKETEEYLSPRGWRSLDGNEPLPKTMRDRFGPSVACVRAYTDPHDRRITARVMVTLELAPLASDGWAETLSATFQSLTAPLLHDTPRADRVLRDTAQSAFPVPIQLFDARGAPVFRIKGLRTSPQRVTHSSILPEYYAQTTLARTDVTDAMVYRAVYCRTIDTRP